MGKLGNNVATIRLVIDSLEDELRTKELYTNTGLKVIQRNYLTKILNKAKRDLEIANLYPSTAK